MKILIVEDDATLSEFLQAYLRRMNHETVDLCPTAEEAFTLAGQEDYDCAFIDVMLPDMSGLELIEKIRSQNLALPVVVMSGHDARDINIKGVDSGKIAYIQKPFSKWDLQNLISNVK